MRRLILALAVLAAAAVMVSLTGGCPPVANVTGDVIPGVAFPSVYTVLVTPDGQAEPLATVHRLSVTAPAANTGHPFEITLQPVSSLDVSGAIDVATGRAPASIPAVDGTTVAVTVTSSDFASVVEYKGLVGYEVSGAVLARSGSLVVTFYDTAEGAKKLTGTFLFTCDDSQVPSALRTYSGTLAGDYLPNPTDDGGGGGGGSGPPEPPF